MTAGTSNDQDELAVHAVVEAFVKAVRLKDVEGMLSHCAPDVVTFDMMPPPRHEGAAAVREIWTRSLAAFDAPLDCEMRNLKLFVDGRIAFGRGMCRLGGKKLHGGSSDRWTCMTLGLRKIDRDWKIIHQHVSVPIDMETGQAMMDIKP